MTFETAAFYTSIALIGSLIEFIAPGVGFLFVATSFVARWVS